MTVTETTPLMKNATIFLWGAVGGMLPTLGRLAGTYAADFSTPPPAWFGVIMAIGLYGVIGAAIARAMTDGEVKQALFAGIAAPAIVLSVLNGATESKTTKNTVNTVTTKMASTNVDVGTNITFGDHTFVSTKGADTTPTVLQDFVWGLGGSRDAAGKYDPVTTILNRAVKQKMKEPNS